MHKGAEYPGEHDAIIEQGLWVQVHALISESPHKRSTRPSGRTPAILKGLIFGPTGAAMTPAHARKNGKLYRYYVAMDVIRNGSAACPIRRVPAAQIEAVVIAQIKTMVQTPEIIVATWRAAKKSIKGLTEHQVGHQRAPLLIHYLHGLAAETAKGRHSCPRGIRNGPIRQGRYDPWQRVSGPSGPWVRVGRFQRMGGRR
jgi:hypothetical protein